MGGDTAIELERTDEDSWIVPSSWADKAAPFRGRGPVQTPVIDTKAVGRYRGWLAHESMAASVAATAEQEPELAAAARAVIADPESATALGLAVTGILARALDEHRATGSPMSAAQLIDTWISGHGVVLAAEAAVLWAGLGTARRRPGTEPTTCFGAHRVTDPCRDALPTRAMWKLRAHIALLSEADHRTVVERLDRHRAESGALSVRVPASYLVPTRQDWLDRDLADGRSAGGPGYTGEAWSPLACSATTAAQLALLPRHSYIGVIPGRTELFSALVHVGPEAADYLAAAMDAPYLPAEQQRMLAALLAQLPGDAAFAALARRAERPVIRGALMTSMLRFPLRARRILATEVERSPLLDELIHWQARIVFAPEYAAESRPIPEAAPHELPRLFTEPPWEREISAREEVVLSGIGTERASTLAWLPGEQTEWANNDLRVYEPREGWQSRIDAVLRAADPSGYSLAEMFAAAPQELVAPHLGLLRADYFWDWIVLMQRLLGRYGDEVAEVIVGAVRNSPAARAEVLAPVTGTAVTTLMTRLLGSRRGVRAVALTWFERHLERAAPDLVAAALGRPGASRTLARQALSTLNARGHREALCAGAVGLGPEAAAAIEAELSADPLEQLPAVRPELPAWADPRGLPPILLRDSGRALPPAAVSAVCTMLSFCAPGENYPGIAIVAEIAQPRSLAAFGRALFDTWRLAGYPPDHTWALHALGLFGDDDTARDLAPLIRAWPGENAHARAVAGLDVLVSIGSDAALMQLNSIAEKVKFKAIKNTAREKIRELAEEAGLTSEELADRLVPSLGLDARGGIVLDYGSRSFRAGLDEQLRPVIHDSDGTPRKSLPKPGAKDDPELAPLAYKAFTAFKKDAKAAAEEQLRRLERAMTTGRRWTAAIHRPLFAEHPLISQLARRLVWITVDENDAVTGSFRVAEDLSFADVHDEPVTLTADTRVGIAHPLHLGDTITAWSEVFADYELLQPFPQLHRKSYTLAPEENPALTLTRFEGRTVATTKLLGLQRFGWIRGDAEYGDMAVVIHRPLPGGRAAVLALNPGISVAEVLRWSEQQITVFITGTGQENRWSADRTDYSFGGLDAVTASELLRELTQLFDE
ncbi:DUF4132 domain-containing protein [Nocardia sp. NPDC057668]|uniref:DUF4132 domain-containing protein n=1 Tax=Nocardia sp. NPDC057668 TaxID=3346202 RepID=UPI00366CE38E